MEMTAARMRDDLKQIDNFSLASLYVRTKRIVDSLHECQDCRKLRGPEYHATAVLHLGIIEEEIDARGEEVIHVQTSRAQNRFAHAMAPSRN